MKFVEEMRQLLQVLTLGKRTMDLEPYTLMQSPEIFVEEKEDVNRWETRGNTPPNLLATWNFTFNLQTKIVHDI
jgi:hypothetical protein